MAAARTWRWVPVFPIRRSVPSPSLVRLRGIVAENPMRFVPNRCLAACITNTPSRLPALDRVFADHKGHTQDALDKCDEALKYAPNWKQLKEAQETAGKQKR
jgi:hypothetical protein